MPAVDNKEFITSVQPYFSSRRRWRIVCGVLLGGCIVGLGHPILLVAALLSLTPSLVKLFMVSVVLESKVWHEFQEQLGFKLGPTTPIVTSTSVLARLGEVQTPDVLAQGIYGHYYIRLFRLTTHYNPGSKNRHWSRNYRVLQVITNQDFYPVFLDAKRNSPLSTNSPMSVLARSLTANKTLRVEGDINRYFRVYVAENDNADSLLTLSPEKLIALRDYGTAFDIEFAGNSIYVISSSKLASPKSLLMYQNNLLALIDEIGQNLRRDRDTGSQQLIVKTPSVITLM